MINVREIVCIGALLVGCFYLAGKAHGSEWQRLEPEGEYGQVFFDADSIEQIEFGVVNVRVKYRNVYRYGAVDYAYSVSSLMVDCSGKKLTSVRIEDYDVDGSLLSSVKSSGDPWYPINPGSFYDRLYSAVCPITFPLHTEKRFEE